MDPVTIVLLLVFAVAAFSFTAGFLVGASRAVKEEKEHTTNNMSIYVRHRDEELV